MTVKGTVTDTYMAMGHDDSQGTLSTTVAQAMFKLGVKFMIELAVTAGLGGSSFDAHCVCCRGRFPFSLTRTSLVSLKGMF